jgi:phosphatidylinositol glycan class A protein
MSEAIEIVSQGKHDPMRAHERVKTFYDWGHVAERTERVYDSVLMSEQRGLWERMQRYDP